MGSLRSSRSTRSFGVNSDILIAPFYPPDGFKPIGI
jgi:hypothetical protein